MRWRAAVVALALAAPGRAGAQPVAAPTTAQPTPTSRAADADRRATDRRPGTAPAPLAPPPAPAAAPPVQWTEWEVTGTFIDPPTRCARCSSPRCASARRSPTTPSASCARCARRSGYRCSRCAPPGCPPDVEGHARGHADPGGALGRRVDLGDRGVFLDGEIRRRLRLRPGASIPYDDGVRQRLLDEEAQRIRTYLRDEGYFEAGVTIAIARRGAYGATVAVNANLGAAYRIGRVAVENTSQAGGALAVPTDDLQAVFDHRRVCLRRAAADLPRPLHPGPAAGRPRADHPDVPAPRLPGGAGRQRLRSADVVRPQDQDRHAHVKVDERRKLDVVFEGNDPDRVPTRS
jgi:hypothetical protein